MSRFVLLLFIALTVLGCSGLSSPPVEQKDDTLPSTLPPLKPNLTSEPVKLEVWLDLDFTRNNTLYDELATSFEAAYPQVKVEIFSFVRESISGRVAAAVLNNEPPDIAQGHVYAMAGQDLAQPLDEPWAVWEAENPEAARQFLPIAMQEVTWQGRRYGVPLDVYTIILLYNRSHFDQAGIPYPQANYDLFFLQKAAVTLTDSSQERYGVAITTDPWYASAWVASAGGHLVNEIATDKYSPTLNTPITVETLTFLTDLVKAGYAPLPSSRPRDYEDARQQFLAGQVSMYFGEPQDIHLIQSTMPDFPLGVAQLPQTPTTGRSTSVLGASGLFVPKGSRHALVAFEFMKWMASDEYIIPMARRQGRFPAKIWLLTSPDFSKNLSLRPFFDQLETAQPYRLDLFPRSEEAFSDAIKKAFYDLATPAQALREAQQEGLRPPLEPLR